MNAEKRKKRKKRKAGTGMVFVMMVLLSFASYGEQSGPQDEWAVRMEQVQHALSSGSGTTAVPSGANEVTILPEQPVKLQPSAVTGNVVYRDGNGNILQVPNGDSRAGTDGGSGTDGKQDASAPLPVEENSLSETYYEDYDIYCLSIEGKYFFYSSIGNHGLTDRPVAVDIPANMSFTMQKDGVPTPYTSKEVLSETGTYVFTFTMVQNPKDPVSMQKTCRAYYQFRIQPKAIKPASEEKNVEEEPLKETAEENEPQGETAADRLQYEEEAIRNLWYGDTSEENVWYSEAAAEDQPSGEAETVSGTAGETQESADLKNESTDYDFEAGMYRTFFGEDQYLYASVPNGIMTNYEVTLETAGMGESLQILKDGSEYLLPEDQKFGEPGSYSLIINNGEKTYTYGFRILGDAENDLDFYKVPEDMELVAFYIDDINQDVNGFTDPSGNVRLNFTKDGVYRLVIRDSFGAVFDSELIRDTKPPAVTVDVTGAEARINYEDRAEIERVILRSAGKEEVCSIVDSVKKKGTYELEAWDYAGNRTTVNFRVKGKLNKATIISLLLLIGILATGLVFYIRTRKDSGAMEREKL